MTAWPRPTTMADDSRIFIRLWPLAVNMIVRGCGEVTIEESIKAATINSYLSIKLQLLGQTISFKFKIFYRRAKNYFI